MKMETRLNQDKVVATRIVAEAGVAVEDVAAVTTRIKRMRSRPRQTNSNRHRRRKSRQLMSWPRSRKLQRLIKQSNVSQSCWIKHL